MLKSALRCPGNLGAHHIKFFFFFCRFYSFHTVVSRVTVLVIMLLICHGEKLTLLAAFLLRIRTFQHTMDWVHRASSRKALKELSELLGRGVGIDGRLSKKALRFFPIIIF